MKILAFEENGSGRQKIRGLEEYGADLLSVEVISIDAALDEFVDEPEHYISDDFQADLVLDYLVHPDLSFYLISLCRQKGIPVVASGKQAEGALTPFTCCGLGRHHRLGAYGERFGFPEYRVQLEGDRIKSLEVVRGAPCGASWEVVQRVVGTSVEEALALLPREVQYLCTADPAGFDPITGKSPVHYAGYVHRAALEKSIAAARRG